MPAAKVHGDPRRAQMKRVLLTSGVLAGAVVVLALGCRLWWSYRKQALSDTIASARPVIEAIREYARDHGHPPSALADLVPKYMPQVPTPKGPTRHGWVYWGGGDVKQGIGHMHTMDPEAGEWAIGIAVERGFNFELFYSLGDYFVYHPPGRYSKHAYGGVLERVNEWGYYHE